MDTFTEVRPNKAVQLNLPSAVHSDLLGQYEIGIGLWGGY